jgi:hypothetical protein
MTPATSNAIQFLSQNQLPDGEFRTEFRRGREVSATGEVIEDLVFDSSPFVTALTIYSLSFLQEADARIRPMIERGCRFLLSEMEPGGLWRYWSKNNTLWPKEVIPPDLDDTCCASHVLKQHGFAVPNNLGIVTDSRDPKGRFYTWLYKPDSLRKLVLWTRTFGRAFCYSDVIWQFTEKKDVCSVVNANVVHYLGETPLTNPAIDFLIDAVESGKEEATIVFYWSRFSLYYMTSRAYFGGVSRLAKTRGTIVDRIAAQQAPDGSFGDPLVTGQAICTLLNFGVKEGGILDRAYRYLVDTQRPDGSWPRVPMYGGPPTPDTFGSADLTTGVCLEALFRCEQACP